MKKLSLLLAILVVGFYGCKQKDTTPPKIFLSVNDPDSTILNAWYDIPAATADDNFDGSALTSSIIVTHNIPMDSEDPITHSGYTKQASEHMNDYTVTYTVTDNAGLKTTKTLNVVVYNEFVKYSTYYQVKREGDEFIATNYDYYDGKTAYLTPDKKTNWRFYFPKLSDIPGLKVYADCNATTISGVYDINIPSQEKSRIEINQTTGVNDTVLYVVQSNAGTNTLVADTTSTMVNIIINYTLKKYKKTDLAHSQYISAQDTTYGHYWEPFAPQYIDNVTETYKKL